MRNVILLFIFILRRMTNHIVQSNYELHIVYRIGPLSCKVLFKSPIKYVPLNRWFFALLIKLAG